MNSAGENVISLGIGSPDLPPSPETVQTLLESSYKADNHGYQPYTGIPELRNAFSHLYKKWYHVEIDPNKEVLPLIGSKEGIFHISMAFLNPGDGVLVPNPGYPTYSAISNLIGANIVYYDLLEENLWQPDFNALEKLDLSKIKLMWVNYPHMPTGAPASLVLYEKLVKFGKKHGIVICNDNPYSFILNENPLSIFAIDGSKDICIELNSMSKSHNMPGWRIGVVISNPEFIQWILKVKSNIDNGQFKPMMLAAANALFSEIGFHQAMNDVYAKRRIIAEQIMNAMGCTFDHKQSGMFLWGKVPNKYSNGKDLADKILYKTKVFIVPGFIFGSNGDKYVRISLCCKEDLLKEALKRINRIMNSSWLFGHVLSNSSK